MMGDEPVYICIGRKEKANLFFVLPRSAERKVQLFQCGRSGSIGKSDKGCGEGDGKALVAL